MVCAIAIPLTFVVRTEEPCAHLPRPPSYDGEVFFVYLSPAFTLPSSFYCRHNCIVYFYAFLYRMPLFELPVIIIDFVALV